MIKMCQNRFWPRLRPGPHWGSSRRSPRPPSRLGRGYPLPILHPFDDCGVSYLGAFGASSFSPPSSSPAVTSLDPPLPPNTPLFSPTDLLLPKPPRWPWNCFLRFLLLIVFHFLVFSFTDFLFLSPSVDCPSPSVFESSFSCRIVKATYIRFASWQNRLFFFGGGGGFGPSSV